MSTYSWQSGDIPIIDHWSGNVNDFGTEHCGQIIWRKLYDLDELYEKYRIAEGELIKIPDYTFLCENGWNFNKYTYRNRVIYISVFNHFRQVYEYKRKQSAGHNKKGNVVRLEDCIPPAKLFINSMWRHQFGDKEKFIEFLTLNEIKSAASEIKRMIEEVESRKKKVEVEEKDRLDKINHQKELINSALFEISEGHAKSFLAGVYAILCLKTEQVYIGSSENMIVRKNQHLQDLKSKIRTHHSYKLQEAFDKYGESNFKFYALEAIELNSGVINVSKILKQMEQYYINKYHPGLNIEQDAFGRKHYT